MNRVIFIILALLHFVFCANAQDIITTKAGKVIDARITYSDEDKIRFTLNHDPLYTHSMKKSEIRMIRYESGNVETFDSSIQSSDNPVVSGNTWADISIVPYMKYQQLKHIYDHRKYQRSYMDRFSPGWIGVASFFLPGLGECICDEWGRGLGKTVGSATLATIGSILVAKSYVDVNYGTDICFAVLSYLAALGIDIWSIVDAVRIAKVKNMYESDMRVKYALMDVFPSISCVQIGNKVQPTVGITLAMRF